MLSVFLAVTNALSYLAEARLCLQAFEYVLNGPDFGRMIAAACARPLADRVSPCSPETSFASASCSSSSSSSLCSPSSTSGTDLRSGACNLPGPSQMTPFDTAASCPCSLFSISPFSPFFLFSHLFRSSLTGQFSPAPSASSCLSSSALLSAAVADYVDQYLMGMVEVDSETSRSFQDHQVPGVPAPRLKPHQERQHQFGRGKHGKAMLGSKQGDSFAVQDVPRGAQGQSSDEQGDCGLAAGKISFLNGADHRQCAASERTREEGMPCEDSGRCSILHEKHWLVSDGCSRAVPLYFLQAINLGGSVAGPVIQLAAPPDVKGTRPQHVSLLR